MTDFLKKLWISIFGSTECFGLNIGFWMSMLAVFLLVVIMVVVFWSIKPKKTVGDDAEENAEKSEENRE